MQRIRKQQQAGHKLGFGCAENRGLPSPIRMPAKKNTFLRLLSRPCNCVAQACTVALGIARKRRPKPPLLPEWQITSQNQIAVPAESLRQSHKQRSRAVAPGPMRQNQRLAACIARNMHPPAHRRIYLLIEDRSDRFHGWGMRARRGITGPQRSLLMIRGVTFPRPRGKISALNSAPISTTSEIRYIQVNNAIPTPSEP